MFTRKHALVGVFTCLSLVTSRALASDARSSSLSWVRLDGAEGCISTQALARGVEDRLQRKVFVSAAEADVSVEGYLSREGNPPTYRAKITIRDSAGELQGTRDLESAEADCRALDESLVFVVSVLIDPDATSPPEKPATQEPAPPAAKPAPPRVIVRRERVLVPVHAKQPEPWRLRAGAGVGANVGLFPEPAWGVNLALLIEPPHFWPIRVGAGYWIDQSIAAERGASVDVSLAQAGIALCPYGYAGSRFAYRLCAGVLAGSSRSMASGFDRDFDSQRFAAHVELPNDAFVMAFGPVAFTAGASLLLPLRNHELTYRGQDGQERSLYDPPWIALSGRLGVALVLPPP
ncbi:MAG: hypothetical protein R3B13_40590 [Polyangiaceae bacterium]